MKSAAKDAKKQAEKQGEGAVAKLIHVLNDVKNSVLGKRRRSFSSPTIKHLRSSCLETLGLASKAAADATDQAKAKFDEVSGKAKKGAEKAKKKVQETIDL